jgi:two-component system, response regulator YesN
MLKIFITDDDRILRMGIKAIIIKNILDCEIVGEASNGSQALEFISNHEVDLLITDIKMPVMDGVELVKRIYASDFNIKIIVVSGFDEYKYVRETLKHGAVDYLL